MSSTLAEFLTAVLPNVGGYVIAYQGISDIRIKQKYYKFLSGLINFGEIYENEATDVWFAPATYKQGWHEVETKLGSKPVLRTQDNVAYAKALWLDIDVGDDKPYKTRQEASKALAGFIKELGLPRPWVVGSGERGLHLYFVLDEAVERNEWQYLADRLKQACKEHGIHQDPSRTADIASILRMPNTNNMKQVRKGIGQAHKTAVLVHGKSASYETYKQALDKFTPVHDRTHQLPALPTELPSVAIPPHIAQIAHQYFQPIKDDYPIRPAIEVLAGCEQMRLQKGVSEPLWRGMLGTLRHCEHGRYVAHKVSAIDSRYDKDDTDRKLDYLEDNDIAPFTCEYFRAERPDVCARCPNNGMIKSPISVPVRPKIPVKNITSEQTTPASLYVQAETTPQPVSEPVAVVPQLTLPPLELPPLGGAVPNTGEQAQNASLLSATGEPTQVGETPTPQIGTKFEEIKTKNSKVNAGGCWARTKTSDGEWTWVNIYPYPVYPIQKIRGITQKGETCISYIFRKHNAVGHDDIQIAGSTLMGQTLNATLGDYGFLLNDKERKLMAGLLIDLLKETEHSIGEVKTTDRLGWNDTQDAFLCGGKLYKTDGKVVDIAVAGKAKRSSDETIPMGSLDKWKEIANIYNKDGLECFQVAVATAFASPIAPLGSLERAALVFLTGQAGVGKSTALMIATSVFGNPERMVFNKMDTPKSRLHKLGVYSNIAASFDEMTELHPKEASELAYTITQGRGHDKMGSGGEDMLVNTTYWSCIPVMSANDSILAALSQQGNDPTAQMSRVLEIKAVNINKVCTPTELEQNELLARQLLNNYGTAGDVYLRYITAHKAEVLDMIYNIEKMFKKHAELNSTHRFWTFMCTRMIVGVMIANKLGLVKYNVAKLFAYLVKQIRAAKTDLDKYKWTPETMIPQFINANISHRIVVTHAKRPEGMKDDIARGALNDINYVVQSPAHGRELTMRVELDTGNCLISIPAIREWCKKANVAFAQFMQLLEQKYVVVTPRTKRELGKHTVHRGGGRIDCVIVNLPPELTDIGDNDD